MILASTAVVEYDDFKDNHAYNTVGEIIKSDGCILRSSRRTRPTPPLIR